LKLLDPVGAVVEDWELQGAWIQDDNHGDLDYSTSDPVEIALTIRFDQPFFCSNSFLYIAKLSCYAL
jgi:hypothetical protein